MPYDPADAVILKVEIDIAGVKTDITGRGRGRSCVIQQGRSPSATQAESGHLELEIGNDDAWLTEDNPESPWWGYWGRGCKIYVSIVGVLGSPTQRFAGEVDTIRLRWDSPERCVAEVDAIGTLAVIAQNDQPLDSAPYRFLATAPAPVPAACWALEDGELVDLGKPLWGSQSLQPFVGTHPSGGVVTFPRFGQGTLAPWLPPVVSRTTSSGLSILWAKVSMPSFTTTWAVDLAYTSETDAPESNIDINPSYIGGSALWPQLIFNTAGREILVTFNGAPEVNVPTPRLYDGNVHHVRWQITVSGGATNWWVYIDGVQAGTGTVAAYAQGAITRIAHVVDGSTGSGALAIGYLTVWTSISAFDDVTRAIQGYAGELDGDRIGRLCLEEGVPTDLVHIGTVRMGPQRPAQLVDLLREAEDAGQGLLHDSGVDGAIGYLGASELYNQTATLAVAKGGGISALAPVWDGQYVVNDVTSARPNGGSAHVSDVAHIARIRSRRTASPTVNVEADSQLADDAGWRVRKGITPGARYELVGINLRNPEGSQLADAVLGHAIGDRLTVAASALPPQASPDGIDALTIGWTEILDADTWTFQPNVVPYPPYNVLKIGDQVLGRVAPDPFTVATTATATATSLIVKPSNPGVPLWITTLGRPGDFPFYADVAGEELRVTACASTLRDTFTRTASSGWGTSDSGQTWTNSGGAAADYSVGSGVAAIAFATASVRKQTQAGPSYADVRVRAKIAPTVVATGGQIDQGITLRRDSGSDSAYEILLRFDTDSLVYLRINKVLSASATTLLTQATGIPYTAGSAFWLIADIVGSDMRIKVWPTTGLEPIVWRTFTDSSVTAAGQIGACCRVQAGNTNVPFSPTWDEIELLSPQTFTVARSINAVAKAQTAGNPVGLWRPAALAL